MYGARPGNCTPHLVLTKDLLRYLSLTGVLASSSGFEPDQTAFGEPLPESAGEDRIGLLDTIRTCMYPLTFRLVRSQRVY